MWFTKCYFVSRFYLNQMEHVTFGLCAYFGAVRRNGGHWHTVFCVSMDFFLNFSLSILLLILHVSRERERTCCRLAFTVTVIEWISRCNGVRTESIEYTVFIIFLFSSQNECKWAAFIMAIEQPCSSFPPIRFISIFWHPLAHLVSFGIEMLGIF